MEQKKTGISRRSFLTGTGAAVGALAAGSLVGYNAEAGSTADQPGAGGFTWTDVNVLEVMKYAFNGYNEPFTPPGGSASVAGCCYGAAAGLVKGLRDADNTKLGWKELPLDMFKWGGGGGNSWGTLCGALNGAFAVLNLANFNFCGKMSAWYETALFPLKTDSILGSNLTDFITWAKGHATLGSYATALDNGTFAQSMAYSPLCHASVSRWCVASGYTVTSAQKKFRCAFLTACVAGVAATLANTGNADALAKSNNVDADCAGCHVGTGSKFDSQQGSMDCNGCHDDGLTDTVSGTVYNVAPKCDRAGN